MNTEILKYNSGQIIAQLERSQKPLVSGVGFTVKEGESLALIGETGSGKTIIAQSIMKLLPCNVKMRDGTATFLGRELSAARQMKKLLGVDIVYIPQNGAEFLNPSRRIRQQLYDSLKKLGVPHSALCQTALEKLAGVGLPQPETLLDKYPFQLSGGMAQRVTIAISACSTAKLLIADEPTNGLDHAGKLDFLNLLSSMFPGAAKLVITHDIAVAELCDRTLVLCRGRMMETGPSKVILHEPHQPYTKALLASLVKNGMHETPVLRREFGFCPYYRRCPEAAEACKSEQLHHCENETEWWCNAT